MPRTLDPEAHALRRDAFVDAAIGLIASKGYEQLSIQDVLDELGASKGAFYHYFDSKAALLAAVVERMVEAATATIEPIAGDPCLSALQKLQAVLPGIAQWKGQRPELRPERLPELMETWLSDENAIVRERMRRAVSARLTPLLVAILRQGITDGAFSVSSPEGAASVFVALILGLNETATQLYLARRARAVSFDDVKCTLTAYTGAFEGILGIPRGSWPGVDDATLRPWFD